MSNYCAIHIYSLCLRIFEEDASPFAKGELWLIVFTLIGYDLKLVKNELYFLTRMEIISSFK